jgi:hypothetical protein
VDWGPLSGPGFLLGLSPAPPSLIDLPSTDRPLGAGSRKLSLFPFLLFEVRPGRQGLRKEKGEGGQLQRPGPSWRACTPPQAPSLVSDAYSVLESLLLTHLLLPLPSTQALSQWGSLPSSFLLD